MPLSPLDLVADVATAAAGAATRVVLARRVSTAFEGHVPIAWCTLGWCGPADVVAQVVEARRVTSGWHVVEARRRVAGTWAREALLRGRAVETRLDGPRSPRDSDGSHERRADTARAARTGARRLLVLPLQEEGVTVGFAALGLRAGGPALDAEALRRALAAALLAGHRACATIARVAAASRRAHEDVATLRRQLGTLDAGAGLVARSVAMRSAIERADLVAGHDTPVLLRGETGTGKGELARWIHARSRRARGPFVHVDCGALPPSLIESELFGHEPGAFTGAGGRLVGRFERARGGTILLDEVAELPLLAQVKLLHVLQTGEVQPLGGERPVRVDARIIAATHRPLETLVEQGALRQDLLFRLDVFPIVVPPLRARPEDVPALTAALLARIAARHDRPASAVAPAALAALARHGWPGNVRELGNVLERATIFARGGEIDLAALQESGFGQARRAPPVPDGAAPAAERPPPGDHVETFEDGVRAILARALTASRGRIWGVDGAAARLGLPPTTVQTKLRRWGVFPADFRA